MMKRMGVFLGFAAVLVTFTAAARMASIDGKWTGQFNGPEGAIELVLDLKANAEVLTGTATFPMFPEIALSNGKVTATEVAFDLVFTEMSFTLPFRGSLDGDVLKLAIQVPIGGDTIAFKRVVATN
jgi:hypothetical protein